MLILKNWQNVYVTIQKWMSVQEAKFMFFEGLKDSKLMSCMLVNDNVNRLFLISLTVSIDDDM